MVAAAVGTLISPEEVPCGALRVTVGHAKLHPVVTGDVLCGPQPFLLVDEVVRCRRVHGPEAADVQHLADSEDLSGRGPFHLTVTVSTRYRAGSRGRWVPS